MHRKIKYRTSNLCFDYFLGVFKRMLPPDNCLPKDHKQAQKVLNGLGLDYEKFTLAKTIACYSTKSMKRWIHALYAKSRGSR